MGETFFVNDLEDMCNLMCGFVEYDVPVAKECPVCNKGPVTDIEDNMCFRTYCPICGLDAGIKNSEKLSVRKWNRLVSKMEKQKGIK